jgi:PAS domain S-box-containing protein
MKDTSTANQELIQENALLRQKIQELENSKAELRLAKEARLTGEQLYPSLFETSQDSIFIVDQETGAFLSANTAACQLYGYTREEFLKMSHVDISAEPEKTKTAVHNCISKVDVRLHRKKDGTVFSVDISASLATLNNRKIIQAVIRDISEQKLAEKALKQTHQNYESFFNTIDDFLFVLDEQGNIIHVNTTVIKRLGYAREELIGKSVLIVHPPERIEEAGKIIAEMLRGEAEFCPVPIITKTGVQIPVETRVSYGVWNGKPALFGDTKDISKIQLSEEKFSKVFHINPSACGLSDLEDHRYIELNEAFYKLLGFNKDEVIGKTPIELGILSSEERDAILYKSYNNGTVTNAEANLKAKNGEIKHVLLSAENINVQDKKYRFTVVHDITDLKRSEEDLKKYRDQLEEMVNERTAELEIKTMALIQTNTALKVLLQQREYDKKDMEERFMMNLHTLVLPHIEEMKKGSLDMRQQSHLNIVETHLNEITSPMLKNMQQFYLTPKETKIASLLRRDKSTKEIAEILKISSGSIDVHRKNIRKKLGLTNKKANLASFLKNLE